MNFSLPCVLSLIQQSEKSGASEFRNTPESRSRKSICADFIKRRLGSHFPISLIDQVADQNRDKFLDQL